MKPPIITGPPDRADRARNLAELLKLIDPAGVVCFSSFPKPASASSRFAPHISSIGRKHPHTAVHSGLPNSAQR